MSSPLIYAIIYFAIVIFGAWFYFRGRTKTVEDFNTGGKTLKWYMVAFSVSLVPLGSGHTINLAEASVVNGAQMLWWPVIVGGFFLPVALLWFGPWLRELGVSSMPESMQKMFGKNMGYLHGAANIASWTGITMAETIVTGTAIYGLTGGAVPLFPWCILIAFVLIVVYVIFGGILQYSLVSTINGAVMIIGSYLALFMVGGWLVSQGMGFDFIGDHYINLGELWRLEVFRITPDLVTGMIIPIGVLHITAAAVTQGVYVPMFAAKSNREIRKASFLAAGVNGISSFPWVMLAMIGMAIPAVVAMAPESLVGKLIVQNLALTALPAPIVGLLMVCLLCATLSTGSAVILGNSQVIVDMIIKGAFRPKMKDETRMKLMRPMIIICAAIACVPAFFNAQIFPVFLWCFTFGVPIFTVWFIGMVWKVSKPAAWITVIAGLLVNFWWTFATPSWVTGFWGANVYPVAIVSFAVGIILNLILPGEKGMLLRVRAEKKAKGLAEEGVSFDSIGM